MNKLFYSLLLVCLMLFALVPAMAQEDSAEEEQKLEEGWNTAMSIGLDMAQLFQFNPKQGAGQNRFGFGGGLFIDGIYKRNRLLWENGIAWQFGVQKLGAGVLVLPFVEKSEKVPFQKTIDELRLGSKLGYAFKQDSKWYFSGAFTLFTGIAPSYPGPPTYPGNFLRNFVDTITNTKFFAPANITLSLGIEYIPNENFSIYYSPLAAKWIVVADDQIAALGIHGNPVRGMRDPDTGLFTDFDNTFSQLGSLIRASYRKEFLNDRMNYRSSLLLYSNYLKNPQNIDVDWTNELSLTLFGNLKLSLLVNLFYDDDVLVQITDLNSPNGVKGVGKRVNITQQLLISYGFDF